MWFSEFQILCGYFSPLACLGSSVVAAVVPAVVVFVVFMIVCAIMAFVMYVRCRRMRAFRTQSGIPVNLQVLPPAGEADEKLQILMK